MYFATSPCIGARTCFMVICLKHAIYRKWHHIWSQSWTECIPLWCSYKCDKWQQNYFVLQRWEITYAYNRSQRNFLIGNIISRFVLAIIKIHLHMPQTTHHTIMWRMPVYTNGSYIVFTWKTLSSSLNSSKYPGAADDALRASQHLYLTLPWYWDWQPAGRW